MNYQKISTRSYRLIIVLTLLISSCKTPVIISRGTSFGHCVGYCRKEFLVSANKAVYSQSKNGDQPETKQTITVLPKGTYDQLLKSMDFQAFYLLDKTIGCPDCADGGAEWIEVESGKKKTRVTFEYGKVPEKLKAAAGQLKKLQDSVEK